MSIAVKTVAPSRTRSHRSSSLSSSSRSGANRTTNDLLERIHAAETRSHRARSHAGSLIIAENAPDRRSVEDINAEIAALEAEARAKNLERKAFEERDLAYHIRERPREEIIEERRVYERRPRRREEEIVLFDKERSRSLSTRRGGEMIYVTPEFRGEDDVVVYERRRSRTPPRNVIRVEKDRKGRLALVRSAH